MIISQSQAVRQMSLNERQKRMRDCQREKGRQSGQSIVHSSAVARLSSVKAPKFCPAPPLLPPSRGPEPFFFVRLTDSRCLFLEKPLKLSRSFACASSISSLQSKSRTVLEPDTENGEKPKGENSLSLVFPPIVDAALFQPLLVLSFLVVTELIVTTAAGFQETEE